MQELANLLRLPRAPLRVPEERGQKPCLRQLKFVMVTDRREGERVSEEPESERERMMACLAAGCRPALVRAIAVAR